MRKMQEHTVRHLLAFSGPHQKPSMGSEFWSKVRPDATDPDAGCALWLGKFDARGRAIHWQNEEYVKAKDVAYILAYKERIPEGSYVVQYCKNKACIQPLHMYLHTPESKAMEQGEKKDGRMKLTDQEVRDIRDAWVTRSASKAALARKYNVSILTIYSIIDRTSRKDVV